MVVTVALGAFAIVVRFDHARLYYSSSTMSYAEVGRFGRIQATRLLPWELREESFIPSCLE
jgi:hypothetical protein